MPLFVHVYHGVAHRLVSDPCTMTTEFELPCAECGDALVRGEVARGERTITVAECPSCGGQYYPESALERLYMPKVARIMSRVPGPSPTATIAISNKSA